MRHAYTIFSDTLAARWPAPGGSSRPPHSSVTNRWAAGALSSPAGCCAAALSKESDEARMGAESSASDSSSDEFGARLTSSDSEHDVGSEELSHSGSSYIQISKSLRGKSAADIRNFAKATWPQWIDNRYWLLTPSGQEVAAPLPDEAAAVFHALSSAELGPGGPKYDARLGRFPRDPLVAGLVEALRLTPPRKLELQGDGAHGEKKGGNFRSKAAAAPPGAAGNVELTPRVVHVAALSLAWSGQGTHWHAEMENLVNKLPHSTFRNLQDVRPRLIQDTVTVPFCRQMSSHQ